MEICYLNFGKNLNIWWMGLKHEFHDFVNITSDILVFETRYIFQLSFQL